MRCGNCEAELPLDEPGGEKHACPNCGSTARLYEQEMTAHVSATASIERRVERGVNDARMAAFAVIFTTVVGVGMTVGFARGLLLGLLASALTAAATALLLVAVSRVPVVRRVVMDLTHRITGQ